MISAALSLAFSQAGGWLISTRVLEISYRWYPGASFLLLTAYTLIVILAGLFSSRSILRKKPVVFLREQTMEG